MKAYYDSDASLESLKDKKIAVLGFGSQGHAHALNLKESGMNVVVGARKDGTSWKKATDLGMTVMEIDASSKWADVVMVLLPDQDQKKVYDEQIAQNMEDGNTLVFAHGFNIHYKQIVPPETINVMMIAPKSPGHLVRRTFREGNGVPCLIAIHNDYSGNTKEMALAWAKGIGGTRAGVIETNFKNETETDLFGEQAVLCGGSAELIKAGFEVLTEAGYPEELAYFEVMHEMKLIVDLYYEGGLSRMNYSVSDTAEYGGYVTGPKIINAESKKAMKAALLEIQDGTFAKNFVAEVNGDKANMTRLRKENSEHPIEKIGAKLRGMMSWVKNKNDED
ncbi:MAG: ketol-acid reductoisomerase [Ignavibacteriales bacterium CG18_big_fil_WC_8_21_14_2_50_31_20]|nr:MAG: ketol-acid reductoisomerase [Ignavibacteriales bacterium CG18_big_fil_WC_8_21_14_2_50_31_20]